MHCGNKVSTSLSLLWNSSYQTSIRCWRKMMNILSVFAWNETHARRMRGWQFDRKNNDLFKREMLFSVFGCNTMALDRLTPDKCDDYYQKASSNCACFEVTSNFQHKLPTICAVNCFPYVNVAMTKCNQNVDTNEHGFSRLMFTYFIFAQWFRKPYFWLVKILQRPNWYTIFVNKSCEQDRCQMSGEHFVDALLTYGKQVLSNRT